MSAHYAYLYTDVNDLPVYVGCSNNPERRRDDHRREADWHTEDLTLTSFGPFPRRLAYQIETVLISALNPRANVMNTDRDVRKAGNWQVNLAAEPRRMIRGLRVTHYAATGIGDLHWSACGAVRNVSRVFESTAPATCRMCIRHESKRRNDAGYRPGETTQEFIARLECAA